MGTIMNGVYWAISKIMLTWHAVWDVIFSKALLGTNWQWILAIVFLVVTVRAILFPVFVKQIKSQRAMQALQPKIAELREKHKGDRETLNRETAKLMQQENANPLMGCLPMFLQIPVFIGLFHVLKWLSRPVRDNKTLYGWTVGEFDSASHAKFFGAPIAASIKSNAVFLDTLNASAGITKMWVVLLTLAMAGTSYLTSRQMVRKSGPATDPNARIMQTMMLYVIPASALATGLLYGFPIGVIIYWVVNNLLSLGQQHWVMKKYPLPATLAAAAAAGGSAAVSPAKKSDVAVKKGLLARLAERAQAAQDARSSSPSARGTTSKSTNAARPATTKSAPAKASSNGSTPAKDTAASKGSPTKGAQNKGGKTVNGTPPAVPMKAAAPKPGAKPANPKKGQPQKKGTAKRPS